jgi:hypothetical protein
MAFGQSKDYMSDMKKLMVEELKKSIIKQDNLKTPSNIQISMDVVSRNIKKEVERIYKGEMREEELKRGYEEYVRMSKEEEKEIEEISEVVKNVGELARRNKKSGSEAILNYINKTEDFKRVCLGKRCYNKNNWLKGCLRGYLKYYLD